MLIMSVRGRNLGIYVHLFLLRGGVTDLRIQQTYALTVSPRTPKHASFNRKQGSRVRGRRRCVREDITGVKMHIINAQRTLTHVKIHFPCVSTPYSAHFLNLPAFPRR